MDSPACQICGVSISKRKGKKFCSRRCYAEAFQRGLVINSGVFKKGNISPNKGKTLESWVGEERASEIRERMSRNSRSKAPFLRQLNKTADVLQKRKISRWFHEDVVESLVGRLRNEGWRGYILSEYIKEKRTPDAILFDGKELVALEVELQKKWKPSQESMTSRLEDLNRASGFFDRTVVVFPKEGDGLATLLPVMLAKARRQGSVNSSAHA